MKLKLNNIFLNVFFMSILISFSANAAFTCSQLDGAFIFSQEESPKYLGFLGSDSALESVNNPYGTFGNPLNLISVRNTLGEYGNAVGQFSALNSLSSYPPALFQNGVLIGYLTNNTIINYGVSLAAIDKSCNLSSAAPSFEPAPLTGLSAFNGRDFVVLEWDENFLATSYNVYNCLTSTCSDYKLIDTISGNKISFTSLESLSQYRFTIQPSNSYGNGSSQSVSISTTTFNLKDQDIDNDGISDFDDFYPLIPLGDRTDNDNDGIPNVCDEVCNLLGMSYDLDIDGNGINDLIEDEDIDGIINSQDAYPSISISILADIDQDGSPDVCNDECILTGMEADQDIDGDGIPNDDDIFPEKSLVIKSYIKSSEDIPEGGYVESNSSGDVIVISNPKYSNEQFKRLGKVSVYKNFDENWRQIGESFTGEFDFNSVGYASSLNANGDVLVILTYRNSSDEDSLSSVNTYQYFNNSWYMAAEQLNISRSKDIALSTNGKILVILKTVGIARYHLLNGIWVLVYEDETFSGEYVDISAYAEYITIQNKLNEKSRLLRWKDNSYFSESISKSSHINNSGEITLNRDSSHTSIYRRGDYLESFQQHKYVGVTSTSSLANGANALSGTGRVFVVGSSERVRPTDEIKVGAFTINTVLSDEGIIGGHRRVAEIFGTELMQIGDEKRTLDIDLDGTHIFASSFNSNKTSIYRQVLTKLADFDNDGAPDECNSMCLSLGMTSDTDDDNDGVSDNMDEFPFDYSESIDTDSDGIGNNADKDDDGDGVSDESDQYPLISLGDLIDTDGDGIPNNCNTSCVASGMVSDVDDDNDGVADINDAYPLISIGNLIDFDGDGLPNDCDEVCIALGMSKDMDDDGDGVLDSNDVFPLDPEKATLQDDDIAPIVTAPADIYLIATGALTDVELLQASVVDNLEILFAEPDNNGPFASGETVITWLATDSAGNTGKDTQSLFTTPLVSIENTGQIEPLESITITVSLSGQAVDYPVLIPILTDNKSVVLSTTELEILTGTIGSFILRVNEDMVDNAFNVSIGQPTNAALGSNTTMRIEVLYNKEIAPYTLLEQLTPTFASLISTAKIIVTSSEGENFFDVAKYISNATTDNPVSVVGETFLISGSSEIDGFMVQPGVKYDLTNLKGGIDKLYFSGPLAEYADSILLDAATGVMQVSRLTDVGEEIVQFIATASAADTLIFTDGALSTADVKAAVSSQTPLTDLTLDTSIKALDDKTVTGATVKHIVLNSEGGSVMGLGPSIKTLISGNSGIDQIYVPAGSIVDASNLKSGRDEITVEGNLADYDISLDPSGNIVLNRDVDIDEMIHTESVTVANGGNVATNDLVIFADQQLDISTIKQQL